MPKMMRGVCKYRECGKEFESRQYIPTYCCKEHYQLEEKLLSSEARVLCDKAVTEKKRDQWRKAKAMQRKGTIAYKFMMNSKG